MYHYRAYLGLFFYALVIGERREPGTGRRIFILKRTGPKSCEDRCEQSVSSGLFCEDRVGVDSDRPF